MKPKRANRSIVQAVVLRCESCGKQAKAPGPSAIASRGYWWHRPCAKMWDADTVEFPSDGKLCPRTILTHNTIREARQPVAFKGWVMQEIEMKVLHLTLEKKWFDMIASGKKREEYRAMKPYWHKRLLNKSYDAIRFRNGYQTNAPNMLVELRGLVSGLGIVEWGAPEKESVYILKLGKILDLYNT